jgi:hypothetical protein
VFQIIGVVVTLFGTAVVPCDNGCSFVAGDVQRFQFLRCVGEAMKTLAKLYLVPTMD